MLTVQETAVCRYTELRRPSTVNRRPYTNLSMLLLWYYQCPIYSQRFLFRIQTAHFIYNQEGIYIKSSRCKIAKIILCGFYETINMRTVSSCLQSCHLCVLVTLQTVFFIHSCRLLHATISKL